MDHEQSELRRTVPFIDSGEDASPRFRLDMVLLPPGKAPAPELSARIAENLSLGRMKAVFSAEEAECVVEEQYDACLEHIFAQPLWELLRDGDGRRALLAYLIETRHYLHAALWRMSPGPAAADSRQPSHSSLVHHLLEEADHAIYFERALESIGVPAAVVRHLRPAPATVEWVHVMRAVAGASPLTAALCSGLMERSAGERDSVSGWHRLLVERGLLSSEAMEAIFDHVREDIALGHGEIWREVLRLEAPLPAAVLADSLNAIVTVTEMIVRWLDSLVHGATGAAIETLIESRLSPAGDAGCRAGVDHFFRSGPVWPASILDSVAHSKLPAGAARAVALAYALPLDHSIAGYEEPVRQLRALCPTDGVGNSLESLKELVGGWLCAVDGHRLWSAMAAGEEPALIEGWLVENFFYLREANAHGAAAIASCDEPAVRRHLHRHLAEEADHARILEQPLRGSNWLPPLERVRPLPTTLAFTGALRDLARRDWAAYCVALYFLQSTLSDADPRHGGFYEAAERSLPQVADLLQAMRRHDRIDTQAEHESDMTAMIADVVAGGALSPLSLQRASLIPQLVWSFLDGIHQHYRQGPLALAQRVGWSA